MSSLGIFVIAVNALAGLIGPIIIIAAVLLVTKVCFNRAAQPATADETKRGCLGIIRWAIRFAALPIALFIGLMIVSVGGAIQPKITQVAESLVCDTPTQIDSRGYSYKPGQQGTSISFTCTDTQGQKKDVTLKMIGAATLLYSAAVLVFLLPALWGLSLLIKPRSAADRATRINSEVASVLSNFSSSGNAQIFSTDQLKSQFGMHGSDDIATRLQKLTELHAKGLITNSEYETRKAEILKDL